MKINVLQAYTWLRSKLTTIVLILLLIGGLGAMTYLYFAEVATSRRYFDNLKAATATIQEFTTRDGHTATKTGAQNLKSGELKKAFPDVADKLHNLYIPVRRAEAYTETSQTIKAELPLTVRDSFVFKTVYDTIPVLILKVGSYEDKWIKIYNVLGQDSGKTTISGIDSTFTAIYRGKRRHPWAWIFSKRTLEVAATNRNPYIETTVIQGGLIKQ